MRTEPVTDALAAAVGQRGGRHRIRVRAPRWPVHLRRLPQAVPPLRDHPVDGHRRRFLRRRDGRIVLGQPETELVDWSNFATHAEARAAVSTGSTGTTTNDCTPRCRCSHHTTSSRPSRGHGSQHDPVRHGGGCSPSFSGVAQSPRDHLPVDRARRLGGRSVGLHRRPRSNAATESASLRGGLMWAGGNPILGPCAWANPSVGQTQAVQTAHNDAGDRVAMRPGSPGGRRTSLRIPPRGREPDRAHPRHFARSHAGSDGRMTRPWMRQDRSVLVAGPALHRQR